MWVPASPCHLPHQGCLTPLDLSDSDDTEDATDTELLSLSNLQLGEREGVEGMVTPCLYNINCSSGPREWQGDS